MNTKNLLLLVCILGFSSLAFAGIDVSFEEVNADGQIVTDASSRLLAQRYNMCFMILYTDYHVNNPGGFQATVNLNSPPYSKAVNLAEIPPIGPPYFHNLHRIAYYGDVCDCTITVSQGPNGTGKSKQYFSKNPDDFFTTTNIDLDSCWASKAEYVNFECTA